MMPNTYERKDHERGIAIILALFLMSAASVLAASLMFLSQTETYATMNYRMMSQARYAGEAAVQKASDFLLDNGPGGQYAIPTVGAGLDPVANYDNTKSPVVCVSGCPNNDPLNPNHWVILSAVSTQPSNYPASAVQTAFNAAAQSTLAAGKTTVTYGAYATLIGLTVFEAYGGTQNVVQTWQITGVGGLTGPKSATVEVVAVVETPKVPANNYAAFATDNTCGALNFGGDVTTASYDSTNMTGSTAPALDNDGGDVGTNGNLTIGGHAEVQGNLYTPRTGVGTCTEGAVNALTETGNADVTDSIVQLPTAIVYPQPQSLPPSVLPAANLSTNVGACALLGLTATYCSVSGTHDVVIDAGALPSLSLPSVSLNGQTNIVLVAHSSPAAQYNFNSINVASQSTISVKATSSTQTVLVNVVGKDNAGVDIATPLDMLGGSFAAVNSCTGCSALCAACSVFDASMLQFVYGGTGEIKMKGNSGAAATFYAPNANIEFGGTSALYGSILGKRINETGTGDINYDRRLGRDFYVAGHPMVGTFSWKRY
jgi:hypothetical protein